MLKYPTTNAIKIEINKFASNFIPSTAPKSNSAINTEGIDNKKLNLNAFSALIKKGKTRKIWFGPEIEFYSPKYLLIEFQKYKSFLRKKFKGTEDEFAVMSKKLLFQVSFISDQQLKPFLPASVFLIDDSKDWLYLACALKEDTIIWSNDKGFKKQKRVKTKTTTEMIDKLGAL